MWDGLFYPFLNFNGATVDVLEWISNSIPHSTGACGYLSTLGLKLNRVSKRGPWRETKSAGHRTWPLLVLRSFKTFSWQKHTLKQLLHEFLRSLQRENELFVQQNIIIWTLTKFHDNGYGSWLSRCFSGIFMIQQHMAKRGYLLKVYDRILCQVSFFLTWMISLVEHCTLIR